MQFVALDEVIDFAVHDVHVVREFFDQFAQFFERVVFWRRWSGHDE